MEKRLDIRNMKDSDIVIINEKLNEYASLYFEYEELTGLLGEPISVEIKECSMVWQALCAGVDELRDCIQNLKELEYELKGRK